MKQGVMPLLVRTDWGPLAHCSTITIFGTPVDITRAELAIEACISTDAMTAHYLPHVAGAPASG
jgi:hypothetical protein